VERLGLIGGTVFYGSRLLVEAETRQESTPYGPALVVVSERLAYLPRHGLDPENYVLPHRINHPANLYALRGLGVSRVVGINSTGGLKLSLKPGDIVVPEDFICLAPGPTAALDEVLHITPRLSRALRLSLLQAARAAGVEVVDGGVYWQSPGPRLETRAEIRLIQGFADVVGMTLASEAVVAQELGLEYASLCSVDNYAHGLVAEPPSDAEIRRAAQANGQKMLAVIQKLLEAAGR